MSENKGTITIGKEIKNARSNKKISLEDLAAKTRINLKILQHIENDHLDELPNITYVKGFIFSLAKELKHDPKEWETTLLNTYKQQDKLSETNDLYRENLDVTAESSEIIANWTQGFLNKKNLIITAAIIFSIGLYQIATYVLNSPMTKDTVDSSENMLKTSSPTEIIEDEVSEQISQEPNQQIKESESVSSHMIPEKSSLAHKKTKTIELDESEIINEKQEQQDESTSAETQTPKEKFPFTKFYPLRSFNITFQDSAPQLTDPNIYPEKLRSQSRKHHLVITASDGESWIGYKKDDEALRSIILSQGKSIKIEADEEILLSMGNAEALSLIYNDSFIEYTGAVKNLILPLERAKEHKVPLFLLNKDQELYFYKDYLKQMASEKTNETVE